MIMIIRSASRHVYAEELCIICTRGYIIRVVARRDESRLSWKKAVSHALQLLRSLSALCPDDTNTTAG